MNDRHIFEKGENVGQWPARQNVLGRLLTSEEDGDENHTLCQRSEQNRLVTNRTCSSGISPSSFGGFHANDAHPNGGTDGSQSNMKTSSHNVFIFLCRLNDGPHGLAMF